MTDYPRDGSVEIEVSNHIEFSRITRVREYGIRGGCVVGRHQSQSQQQKQGNTSRIGNEQEEVIRIRVSSKARERKREYKRTRNSKTALIRASEEGKGEGE